MKRLLYAATGLAAAATLSPAGATLILDESVNGGTSFTTLCSGGPVCIAGLTFTDPAGIVFQVLGASSNAPGTPANADVTQAAVRVTNSSGATQSIILRVGDTGFTAPSGPTTLFNNISGTVVTGSPVNLFSSIACVDGGNGQSNCIGSAIDTPLISANITADNSVGANNNSIGVASLGTPFSLTQVSNFTLGNLSVVTFSNSADVVPASEPAALGLLGVGILGLAFVASRKRRGTSTDAFA